MEDVMRFPSINDVSAELRQINKQTLEPDDADEGIDVRLQVMPDSTWTVNWGSSDYDQDHRGYWGSSSVPGDNRRFDSKEVARDLIEQAREHKATGGDVDERSAPRKMQSRRQPSLPGFPDVPGAIGDIVIPEMAWTQISGDMDPGAYGGLIATADGDHIELLEIQPVAEYVGKGEAAEVGFPFWTREAYYDLDDLDPKNEEVKRALRSSGFDEGNQRDWLVEEATPEQRALVIAEALMRYGTGVEEGPSGWSKDLPDHKVKWNSGKIATIPEYIADEDDEFRREVLGEEDEDEEEEDEGTVTYSMPIYWASYLINGDASGMEDDEIKEADEAIEAIGLGSPVDVGESEFRNRGDYGHLAGDYADYTFIDKGE